MISCYILAAGGQSYLVTQRLFCEQHKKTLVICTHYWLWLSFSDSAHKAWFLTVEDRLWLVVIRCRDGAAPAVMFVANCRLSHNILHSQLDCHTKFQKIWTHQNSTRDFYIPPRVAGGWWWKGGKGWQRNFEKLFTMFLLKRFKGLVHLQWVQLSEKFIILMDGQL